MARGYLECQSVKNMLMLVRYGEKLVKNHKARSTKKKLRKNPTKPPPAKKAKRDFEPQEIDETNPGESIAFVGGVRAPQSKDFEPEEIDTTMDGEEVVGFVGGVRPPPKKNFEPQEILEEAPGEGMIFIGRQQPPKKS